MISRINEILHSTKKKNIYIYKKPDRYLDR